MTWFYCNKEFDVETIEAEAIGFVYLITNLTNGKKYSGKKKFRKSIKLRATKKRKAKRVQKTSDWTSYFGSSADLLHDVETLGERHFRRDILHLCRSLGELSYMEIKEQIDHRVLYRDDFYNSYIGCRIHRKHLKKKFT